MIVPRPRCVQPQNFAISTLGEVFEHAKHRSDARAAAHEHHWASATLVEHEVAPWRMHQHRIALPHEAMKESGHRARSYIQGPYRRIFPLDADPELVAVRRR